VAPATHSGGAIMAARNGIAYAVASRRRRAFAL
jgi:hypothetical protein